LRLGAGVISAVALTISGKVYMVLKQRRRERLKIRLLLAMAILEALICVTLKYGSHYEPRTGIYLNEGDQIMNRKLKKKEL
jgi:uncharacterized membrane protein